MYKFRIILWPKEIFRQALLASIGFSRGSSTGSIYAFSTVLLYQLEYDESIKLTSEDSSWIGTIIITCILLASLTSALIIGILGRKTTMIIMDSLTFMAWLLIFYCYNYAMLLTASILSGISMGIFYTTLVIFMGEVSTPQYRTTFLCLPNLGLNFGFFLCQLVGHYVHWKICGAIFAWFSIYNIFNLLCLRESYVTYLEQGKIETAREYYEWFRGTDSQSTEEFADILRERERKKANTYIEKFQLCRSKSFLTPFYITVVVYLANKFCGVQSMVHSTEEILMQINRDSNFVHNGFVILSVVRVCTVISSIFIVKFFSVRFMILSSGYLLCISLLALEGFMYCSRIYDHRAFPILSLVALIINVILYSLGLGAFTTVISGEMFPHTTRTIGISLSVACLYFFAFLLTRCLPSLIAYVGAYGTMTMFGFCTLFTIIVIHLTLPQTKNKTLIEINREYQD